MNKYQLSKVLSASRRASHSIVIGLLLSVMLSIILGLLLSIPAIAFYSAGAQQPPMAYQEAQCAYSIYPEEAHFSKMGGIFSVSVDASEYDCKWATQEKLSWVSVSLGSSQGSKPVIVQVGVNVGPPRSGAVGIAGHMFSITQD